MFSLNRKQIKPENRLKSLLLGKSVARQIWRSSATHFWEDGYRKTWGVIPYFRGPNEHFWESKAFQGRARSCKGHRNVAQRLRAQIATLGTDGSRP